MEKKGNKIALIIMIVIILVVTITIKAIIIGKNPAESGEKGCLQDSDCVKVQLGCCSCHEGGEEKCVLKGSEEFNDAKNRDCPKDLFCMQLENCKIQSCKCENKECVGD